MEFLVDGKMWKNFEIYFILSCKEIRFIIYEEYCLTSLYLLMEIYIKVDYFIWYK